MVASGVVVHISCLYRIGALDDWAVGISIFALKSIAALQVFIRAVVMTGRPPKRIILATTIVQAVLIAAITALTANPALLGELSISAVIIVIIYYIIFYRTTPPSTP